MWTYITTGTAFTFYTPSLINSDDFAAYQSLCKSTCHFSSNIGYMLLGAKLFMHTATGWVLTGEETLVSQIIRRCNNFEYQNPQSGVLP